MIFRVICCQGINENFWTLATNGANMCVGVCVTRSAQPLTETETSVTVDTGQSTQSFCFFRWKPQTVAEVMQRRWPAALTATSDSSSAVTTRDPTALIHAVVVCCYWSGFCGRYWLLGGMETCWGLLSIVHPSVGSSATGRRYCVIATASRNLHVIDSN